MNGAIVINKPKGLKERATTLAGAHSMRIAVLVFSTALSLVAGYGPDAKQQEGDRLSGVRVVVSGQRWLTAREFEELQKSYDDVFWIPPVASVKVQLINNGKRGLYFLREEGTLSLVGYHLYRQSGKVEWHSANPFRGREGPPCTEFKEGFVWDYLPPGGSLEVPFHFAADPRAEIEYTESVCAKARSESSPVEINSEPFRLPASNTSRSTTKPDSQ